MVGRSFFSTEFGEGDLGDGLVYWKGYYQSLRAAQLGLSLNIGIVTSRSICSLCLHLLLQNTV